MPPISPSLQMRALFGQNTTVTTGSGTALQVVCAWPVSGQYGPGSRVLYYVLMAACVFARKTDWLRNACLAAVLLFPAVAALHGITLAALHVDGAIDMDIYGAFQLCSLGILAAPVTARLSRTYFDDPGRNMIFLWTGLILAGLLSLTVEFFRTHTTECAFDDSNNPVSLSVSRFPYGIGCGLKCSTEDGPFSPMRRGAANNIYVIPAPDKLSFNTATLLAAACCIPAVLSLVSMWNKILEINWKTRFHDTDEHMNEQIDGTNGATVGKMNMINSWVRTFLSAVEAPLFGAAVIAILIIGEMNFFSSQVRYQTEPIASIGQWANIVGTGLAVLGSLYVALAKIMSNTEDVPRSNHSDDCMEEIEGASISNLSFHSVANSNTNTNNISVSNGLRRTSSELMQVVSRPSLAQSNYSSTVDSGNRRKVAKMLTTVADYLGTAGHGQFDDSAFRRGKASDFPEIPGEAHRNKKLTRIRERYNPDRDADGNLTPASPGGLSRTGSFQLSRSSDPQMSPPLQRTVSPRDTRRRSSSIERRSLELQDTPVPLQRRARRDTLEVPSPAHIPSRPMQERSGVSSAGPAED